MRVLLCNERLLFRFGVDRVLLLLAEALRSRGHHVALMAQRMDLEVATEVADRVIEVPSPEVPYSDLDGHTARWLEGSWKSFFPPGHEPDLAVIGGWPFFTAIGWLGRAGVATVFLDCGAVPLDGFEGEARQVQMKLRELRRRYLPEASAAIAISRFIAETQTRIEAPHLEDVRAILLGADHLDGALWGAEVAADLPMERIEALEREGRKLVLNLGRWEPNCYKRSGAVFEIVRHLVTEGVRDFAIGILEREGAVQVPQDVAPYVIPLGYPSDAELVEIMDRAQAGISVSEWEGFNLPVAEMQWQKKPVLALDLAAHPEVVCHSWSLARDHGEMAVKLATLLNAGHPHPKELARALASFRLRFTWEKVQQRYVEALESLVRSLERPVPVEPVNPGKQLRRPVIVIDVSQAACDTANSGVMRVTRSLCRSLQDLAEVAFAVWDQELSIHRLPMEAEYLFIGSFNGPCTRGLRHSEPGRAVPLSAALAEAGTRADCLLLTELVRESIARPIRRSAQAKNLPVSAIFYDAIPVIHPEFVSDVEVRENHARYMLGLAECDAVIPISRYSQSCLEEFWDSRGVATGPSRPRVRTVLLPDEFGRARRRRRPKSLNPGESVDILCVSTLEPRKNHLNLLAAMGQVTTLAPDLEWRLHLVGNRYMGAESISLAVESAAEADPRIRLHGVVEDSVLHELYSRATFTVYPSSVEGYGMPIVESLWFATPVVCHYQGVMRELAEPGGCHLADVREPASLASAILRLATDPDLYDELSSQAIGRETRCWDTYSRQVLKHLVPTHSNPQAAAF